MKRPNMMNRCNATGLDHFGRRQLIVLAILSCGVCANGLAEDVDEDVFPPTALLIKQYADQQLWRHWEDIDVVTKAWIDSVVAPTLRPSGQQLHWVDLSSGERSYDRTTISYRKDGYAITSLQTVSFIAFEVECQGEWNSQTALSFATQFLEGANSVEWKASEKLDGEDNTNHWISATTDGDNVGVRHWLGRTQLMYKGDTLRIVVPKVFRRAEKTLYWPTSIWYRNIQWFRNVRRTPIEEIKDWMGQDLATAFLEGRLRPLIRDPQPEYAMWHKLLSKGLQCDNCLYSPTNDSGSIRLVIDAESAAVVQSAVAVAVAMYSPKITATNTAPNTTNVDIVLQVVERLFNRKVFSRSDDHSETCEWRVNKYDDEKGRVSCVTREGETTPLQMTYKIEEGRVTFHIKKTVALQKAVEQANQE